MVGICGVLGPDAPAVETVADHVPGRDGDVTRRFDDGRVALRTSFHSLFDDGQPATVDGGDVMLWLWGDVYGYDDGSGYVPRADAPGGAAQYCADRYAADGLAFADGLNGDFAAVVYDRAADRVSFVTDRVATRPLFYARPDAETFVFASTPQAIPHHPAVEPGFDLPLLYEYLQLRRVFGVETPLEGVRELPPASVVTVDLEDHSLDRRTYWRPHHDPVEKDVSTVAAELSETFRRVLSEWTDEERDFGVLLSGGSDSRAVLAGMDQPVDTFHVTDWMSRETRITRRVSETAGEGFHLLKRPADVEAETLARSPELSTFSGWFDQAYFTAFEEEIRADADVLVSGLYADNLFGGMPLEMRELSLGPLGTMTLPIDERVGSIDEYVAARTAGTREPLPFFTESWSIADVVRDRIERTGGGIDNHGVRYDSLADLVMYGDYYPMGAGTGAIFSRSLMHLLPYRTPFLDNRLLDLQQRIPRRYLLRRNLVDRVVETLDPELAEIPHAHTGVPLKYPFAVSYLAGHLNQFQWTHLTDDAPAPYFDNGPWPNRRELLRHRDFAADAITEAEERCDSLPFLDHDGVRESYERHADGENHMTELYSLLTFLEMPVTELIANENRRPAAVDRPVTEP
jgi:asparagine synthase (glutamine-hydrolysing)